MLAYIGDGIYVDAFRVVSVHPTRTGIRLSSWTMGTRYAHPCEPNKW